MERRKIIVGLVTLALVVGLSVATVYQVNARFKKSTPATDALPPADDGATAKGDAKPMRAIAMVSDEADANAAAPATGPTDPFRASAYGAAGGGFPVRQANDVQSAPPHNDSAYNAAAASPATELSSPAPQQPLPGGSFAAPSPADAAAAAPPIGASPAGLAPVGSSPIGASPVGASPVGAGVAPQQELVSVPVETAPAAADARTSPLTAQIHDAAHSNTANTLTDDQGPPPANSLRGNPVRPSTTLPAVTAAPEPSAPANSLSSPAPAPAALPAAPAASLGAPAATIDHSLFSRGARPLERPAADLGATALGAGAAVGASAALGAVAGAGTPGARQLEGPQSPALTLEKTAPPEIQVGKPATFQLKVRNVGQATAEQVVVHDLVPKGTRLIDTTPRASRNTDGDLTWELGSLAAGAESTIALQIMPEQEGEIGSVATVNFRAQASARSVCTKPQLVLEHSAPEKVLIGDTMHLAVKISNKGTGAATGLMVEEDVPAGLVHAAGRELEYEVGTLRPGEERVIDLALKADKAGVVENVFSVRGEGNIAVEDRVKIEVVAPQLEVAITGPKVRYLERAATYAVVVANPGTAPAKEVELVTHLPKGLKFVSANQEGQYDPQTHAVFWSLAELPAQQQGQVELTALPIEQGEQKLSVEGKANLGLTSQNEHLITVEGLAALLFEVTDLADPIEVGKDTVYQVKVTNQGSKNAVNVQVSAELPPDLKAIAGEGPTRVSVDGQRAVFEVMPRLAPGENAVFKLQVRGLKAGDQRIRVQLTSDDLKTPVTKEESTRVYADQ